MMVRCVVVGLAALVACVPASRHQQTGAEATPTPIPEPTPAPTQLPSEAPDRASAQPANQCTRILNTDVALLKAASRTLPDGFSEAEAMNAVIQFLVSSGNSIESKDTDPHTVITKPVTGQTLVYDCGINIYLVYAFRVSIVGKQMFVNVDCRRSAGWEDRVDHGVFVPKNRGTLQDCGLNVNVGKGDGGLPALIIDGTIQMMQLRRIP